MTITPEEAQVALRRPRIEGTRSIDVNGVPISVANLKRLVRGRVDAPLVSRPPGDALVTTPVILPIKPLVKPPVTEMDPEQTEGKILGDMMDREGAHKGLPDPQISHHRGDHIKHYLINYIKTDGTFHVEKIAAKGIVSAITIFYMLKHETAIVSVICVL